MEAPASPPALDPRRIHRRAFSALLDARNEFGGKKQILVDGDGRVLTYEEIIRASFALGHALKSGTERGSAVGVLLPTSAGVVVTFFAL